MTTTRWFSSLAFLTMLIFLGLACAPPITGPGDDGSSISDGGQNIDSSGGTDTGTASGEETSPEPASSEEPDTADSATQPEEGEKPTPADQEESTPEEVVEEKEPSRAVSIETKLDKSTAAAGEIVSVTCSILDQYGNAFTADTEVEVTPPGKGTITPTDIRLTEAGQYKVACKLKDNSLKDNTPEDLTILAGTPKHIETTLNPAQIKAGEKTTVTCTVTDEHGNPIAGAKTTFTVSPQDKITITGPSVSGTKAGSYDVTCQLGQGAGALQDTTPATLQIVPGLPARIEVTPDPKKPYYKPEETILLERKVYDQYDNLISSAKVKVTTSPSANVDTSGYPDSVSFKKDGSYEVTVLIDEPTQGGKAVSAKVTFKVDGSGPEIVITYPARAAMITGNAQITVKGTIKDPVSGVASFKINGKSVTPDSVGNFTFAMTSAWGLNLIEAEATDKAGNTGLRAQSFLWSSSYHTLGTNKISRAAVARLNQKALDDGDRATLNDLASILEKVINNIDIDALVPGTLVSGNYKIPPFGPTVSYSVNKNGKVTMGKRTITLRARNGGLTVEAVVHDVRVPLKASAASFLNVSATIVGSSVSITGNIDLSYSNGTVNVSIPSLNADVSKVEVKVFSGIFDFLNGLVTSALRGQIKSALEKAIKGALPDPIKKFLTGFKFDTSFTLPKELGSKKLNISSNLDLLTFDNSGGTLGLAVGLDTTKGITDGKLGTPLRSQMLPTWATTYAFGIGLSYNILNHAMSTAWFSGALKQDLSSLVSGNSSSLPLAPKNLKILVEALLPPILHTGTQGHDIDVGIGDLALDLTFDMQGVGKVTAQAYLTAKFGAKVSLSQNNELSIQLSTQPLLIAVDVTQLSGLGSVNPSELSKLLKGLAPQLSQFLSSSILQKFPIPSIDLSSLGGQYGIPAGTKLTIKKGTLSTSGDYLRITGDL